MVILLAVEVQLLIDIVAKNYHIYFLVSDIFIIFALLNDKNKNMDDKIKKYWEIVNKVKIKSAKRRQNFKTTDDVTFEITENGYENENELK